MFLCKTLFLSFFIIYELPNLITTQEYLKDLKPKVIKFVSPEDLPPVELPRPLDLQRQSKALDETEIFKDELPLHNKRLPKSQRPTLMDIALEASVREGLDAMKRLYTEVEPEMLKKGQVLHANHPAALLSKFSAPVVDTTRHEMAAYATLTATKFFRQNYDVNNDLARQAHSQKVSLRKTALESLCPPRDPPICMPASERYRTHDGTCNNKRRLRWGAAQMPFNRFLPPEYGDGVDITRKASDGGILSSSRFVSLLVHGARDGEASLTLMLAQWGQLLDHDMTSTAQPRSINGSVPSCCGSKDFHPSCFPIKVPLDDPWLSPLKVRCLEFLRSAPAQRRDCVLTWREQTNQATSYIDASPIYSSSVKSSDNARVFRKGLLIFGRGNPNEDVCQRGAIASHCIRSGDGRSGEQPGLLALHHVWVHEHNYIATKLSEMNLHWSDEKIYQETRRIIGAMFQHITYREFLPIVLGREVVKLFDLELLQSGYYEGYDPKVNPTVANAFAAAAFRFGHSLVQNSYIRCDRFHNIISSNVSLHEEFQKGDIGSVGSLHRLLRGMATQRALKRDEFITPELTNHLFQTPGFPFGLDLAAINIQRGRDHGIPPYTHWRVPCGLTPINTWQEFANVVGPESARRISHAYHSVHDIDLFVGGIAERPVVGGLVGPTFACIIAQQFSNSRKGDRFWYENAGFESSFTPAQLHAIRRVSFSSVLCRVVGGGTFQPHIFLPPDVANNERLPCGAPPLDDFDISPWLEQDPFASFTSVQHIQTSTLPPRPLPDRIFDIMHLETKSPSSTDTVISGSKVGFFNRQPTMTLVKDKPIVSPQKPHVEFIPATSATAPKINDKLDLKRKGSKGHVTKQKPVPGVSNKLDKNNRNAGNGLGAIQNTTRRTIIVNNIPIELRKAGRDKPKLKQVDTELDSDNKPKLEARIADFKLETDQNKTIAKETKDSEQEQTITDKKVVTDQENTEKDKVEEKNNNTNTETKQERKREKETEYAASKLTKHEEITAPEPLFSTEQITKTITTTKTPRTVFVQKEFETLVNKSETKNIDNQSKNLQIYKVKETRSTVTDKQSEIVLKIMNLTNNFQSPELKNVTETIAIDINDSDIDPLFQATPFEHKRIQRKLLTATITEQQKDKSKLTSIKGLAKRNNTVTLTNRNLTTKSPKPNRASIRPLELRQYQNRPSYTKPPQKVIVDSVNGDNQYQIEINIRQTNKNQKPLQSTPYLVDYSNGYKISQHDRFSNSYPGTTPIYAYYQPVPTQVSPLTQTQRTKPPTIIIVNEHEHLTTKKPGFLQSIVGWNLGTKRPLSASIGFNERPSQETIINSPHSTASQVAPNFQNLRPHTSQLEGPISTSSFSQAQAGTSIVQASSASVSNGDFGTIAGFASANGADSTFSFNIRPKPDKNQPNERPINIAGTYGLALPPRNPWYNANPQGELPYRENINTPFSTANSQTYYIRNKHEPQRKEELPLAPAQEFLDYDYIGRTLKPLLNISSGELIDDKDLDYEYDEDYGTSPLLKKFNQDGYLRPEHMIGTVLKSNHDEIVTYFTNMTKPETNNHTLDDNYVLPVLNNSKELPKDSAINQPGPLNTNFSNEFTDSLPKHFKNNIFADENSNEQKDKTNDLLGRHHDTNKKVSHKKIAFAPINVLTKPERPDNWVFFDSPKEKEPMLPQIPELKMEPNAADEIPKPFKQNIWLDLAKIKRQQHLNVAGQKDASTIKTVEDTK